MRKPQEAKVGKHTHLLLLLLPLGPSVLRKVPPPFALLQAHADVSKTFSFLGTGAQPPVASKKREGATLNLAAALGLLHWLLPASIDSCLTLYGYHGGLGPGRSPLNPGFCEGR